MAYAREEKYYNKQRYKLISTLEDIGLYALARKHEVIIAGGAIRSVFANEPIKDLDIYFKRLEDRVMMESVMLEEDSGFDIIFESENANTYRAGNMIVQLIKLPSVTLEDPQEIIDQFDFTVIMAAYDVAEEEFYMNERFLEHLAARQLYYNIKGEYPLASLFRVRKYIQKGYRISGVEIVKLGLCINNLQMETFADLKVQLEGIDTVFLQELTDLLLTDEYKDKEYDFVEFMTMIDDFYFELFQEVI